MEETTYLMYKHLDIERNPPSRVRGFKASFFEAKDSNAVPLSLYQNKEKLEEYFSVLLDNLKEGELISIHLIQEVDDD